MFDWVLITPLDTPERKQKKKKKKKKKKNEHVNVNEGSR